VADPGCPKGVVCRLVAEQLRIDVEIAQGDEWPFDTSGCYFLVHGNRERPLLIGPDEDSLLAGVHDIVKYLSLTALQRRMAAIPPLPPPSPLKRIMREEQPLNKLGRALAACIPCCR